jgi:uncharacterized protein
MAVSSSEGPGSVSRVKCNATVKGKGAAQVSLYRHLAPLTVDAIGWALPLDSRVNIQQGMVSMFTTIKVGVEKPKLSFVKGDIAFLASGGLLCLFTSDAKSAVPLNPVGKVDSGLEVLTALRPGDVIRLAKEEG